MKLALIPARGGSKRIPRKNIRHFEGRPIIGYAIDAAISSNEFDQIVVSTDDDEIAAIALDLGASVPFLRPADLSNDETPTVPVVAHAIETCESFGWSFKEVCCIYPTVPLINPLDISNTLEALRKSNSDFGFPISRFHSSPFRALRVRSDGSTVPIFPENELKRTQDLEPAFFDAGQFYWGTRDAWMLKKPLHSNAVGFEIPNWRVVDIDDEGDWIRAESIFRSMQQSETINREKLK